MAIRGILSANVCKKAITFGMVVVRAAVTDIGILPGAGTAAAGTFPWEPEPEFFLKLETDSVPEPEPLKKSRLGIPGQRVSSMVQLQLAASRCQV